jgi:D-amino-acid dehydrogenase
MSSYPRKVLVIGGGVIGASCAYYLARAGHQVTVVELGEFGKGCSHGNCGLVCPSHVLPLAGPGVMQQTLKTFFRRNSPFSIKLRLDRRLWSWLLHFARRCNQHDMLESGRAIQALLNSSRTLYDELFRKESLDAEWETRGLLFVFLTHKAMDHFAHTDQLLREHFGLGAKRLDEAALREREPALKSGLAGGWYYEADAHLRPDKLMAAWRGVLLGRGVKIHEHCAFRSFRRLNNQAEAADTSFGKLEADAFVVATGAWTPQFQETLGCSVPIQPGKGYSMTMPRPGRCPSLPLIFEEHRVVATPLKSGYRLGSIMEFAGYDTSLKPQRLELLRQAAASYLQEPTAEPVTEQWYGWRPMTYDSKPIIDRSLALENVYIAAGHNMLGLSMAPATGKLIAELISGKPPHLDVTPYAVTRFGTGS